MANPVSVKTAILQALSEGPASGSEIRERVLTRTFGVVSPADASLYPMLDRIVDEGLATREAAPARGSSGRPRALLTLTEKGAAQAKRERDALIVWLMSVREASSEPLPAA